MPAFIVTFRTGRRCTVQADEVRPGADGFLDLLAQSCVVATFDRAEVVSVVAREHLISEEPGDVVPHAVTRLDPIPF